eukprot:403360370
MPNYKKSPRLSTNEEYFSIVDNQDESIQGLCFVVVSVKDGSIVKQLCEQNDQRISQVIINTLNQTYLYGPRMLLVGDLTQLNPVFKGRRHAIDIMFSDTNFVSYYLTQNPQYGRIWIQNTTTNYFSHCTLTQPSIFTSYDQYPLIMITKENDANLDISNFEVFKIFEIRIIRSSISGGAQCAGDYLDTTSQKISISIFIFEVSGISASIATLDFNQPAKKVYTFKVFYQAQNGLEVYFYASQFKNLYSSVLAGYVYSSSNPEWGQAQIKQYQLTYQSPIIFLWEILIQRSGIKSTYKYTIKMPALIIEFGICVYDQNCTDEVIGYSILFQNGSAIPKKAMTFSSSTRKLIVSSTDQTFQGQYDLMFRCSLIDGFKSSKNFTVNISYDSTQKAQEYYPNYAPEFVEQLQKKWTIRAGSEATFTLPKYYDPNPEDYVFVKLETVEKYRSFFQNQDQKFILFNAGFPELGDIEMIVTLSDNHKPQPKSTKYRFTITFLQSLFGQMQNDYVNQVNVSTPLIYSFDSNKGINVQSITPDGKVKINFEKKLDLSNITNITQELMNALQIKFDDPNIQNYNWTFTDISEYSFELKISFTNPLIISQSQISTQLNIILINPNLFVNLKTNQSAIIQARMPPQIYDGDNEFLKVISRVFNSTLSSLVVTQAGIQILISQSLQIFWGFVNTQQLISHLPLFQISVPANLYYFYLLVVGSLKFDFLFSSTLIESSFQMDDNYPAYDENFKNFGYDSNQALKNMGFNTFILLLSPVLVGITLALIFLANFFKKLQMISNAFRRIFYEDFDQSNHLALYYYPLYFTRRFVYVLAMMYFRDYAIIQIFVFQIMSVFQVTYLLLVNPFQSKISNKIEIMNESLVLINAYCLIMYTDFNLDPYIKYDIGWACLLLISIVTIGNLTINIIQILRKALTIVRKIRQSFKMSLSNKQKSSNFNSTTDSSMHLKSMESVQQLNISTSISKNTFFKEKLQSQKFDPFSNSELKNKGKTVRVQALNEQESNKEIEIFTDDEHNNKSLRLQKQNNLRGKKSLSYLRNEANNKVTNQDPLDYSFQIN